MGGSICQPPYACSTPSPAAFIDKMLREGVEHHPVMVYGDVTRELAQFCELSGIEFLTP